MHNLDLLLYHAPTSVKVRTQRLVFYRIPAYSYAKAQLSSSKDIYLSSLFSDERGLSLR